MEPSILVVKQSKSAYYPKVTEHQQPDIISEFLRCADCPRVFARIRERLITAMRLYAALGHN